MAGKGQNGWKALIVLKQRNQTKKLDKCVWSFPVGVGAKGGGVFSFYHDSNEYDDEAMLVLRVEHRERNNRGMDTHL